jgi:class 3 adenylate cyclase
MSDIALEHGGTIDKFIGDAIMIFFGDPDTRGQREDALACARMALAMRQRIRETTPDWKKYAGSFELHVRMGINTGYCTVGNFGSSHQLDYTIVGLEVNTASRLESSAGLDQIQISEATYQLIKDDFECRPVGELSVKGLAYPIHTFELIGPADSSARRHESDLTRLLRDELAKLSPTEIDAARKSLAEALASLERRSGDRKG